MILKNKSIRKKGEEMNPRNRNILIVVIVVVIVAIAAFFGFNHKSGESKTANKTVNIGIMTGTKARKEMVGGEVLFKLW